MINVQGNWQMLPETLYQNTVCGYIVLTDGISKKHQTLSLISCNLTLLHVFCTVIDSHKQLK